jgi:hypothetical protein
MRIAGWIMYNSDILRVLYQLPIVALSSEYIEQERPNDQR